MSDNPSELSTALAVTSPAVAEPGMTSPFEGLLDVRCGVTVLLGSKTISVRDCLNFRPGTVVSLRETLGDDLRVYANSIEIASGEVLIIENGTSIRITELISKGSSKD